MDKLNDILDRLYNGKININAEFPNSKEYSSILKESNIILKQIEDKLDDNGKKLLDNYIDTKAQMISIECKEKFIEGYKLAIKLIAAGIK